MDSPPTPKIHTWETMWNICGKNVYLLECFWVSWLEVLRTSMGYGGDFRIHPRFQLLSTSQLLHWEENFLEGRQHKGHHPRLRGIHRGINSVADTSQRPEARLSPMDMRLAEWWPGHSWYLSHPNNDLRNIIKQCALVGGGQGFVGVCQAWTPARVGNMGRSN